jgi:hypothetical protein
MTYLSSVKGEGEERFVFRIFIFLLRFTHDLFVGFVFLFMVNQLQKRVGFVFKVMVT